MTTTGAFAMRRYLLAATAAVAVSLAGMAQAQPLPTMRIGIADDADALDPTLGRTFVGRIVFASLCDKLFDIDAKLNIVPQLAASSQWVDNKTLEIKLRPGVKFHDGTLMDAAAVKFSMERHLTLQGSTRRGEVSSLDQVEIVDPLTVRMILKSPSSPFISLLADRAGMIVPAGSPGADFAKNPICTGPFKFTERVPQDRIVLDRFPDYWDAGKIKLGRVVFRPIADGTVRLANLQSGVLEIAERFEPNELETIRKDPKLRAVVANGLGYVNLTFNHSNGTRARTPMMTDPRVRQAFMLAVDRAGINDVVFNGLHTPVAQAVPPDSPFFDPAVTIPPRDVAKAKALLAAAGVKLPMPVELLVSNSPVQRQIGEVIQSMAAEAGFDVKLRTMEFVSALKASDDGDFEVYLIGWSGRVDIDGNVYNGLKTKGPLNSTGYSDPEVDSILDRAREITDIPQRRALYGRMSQKIQQDLPVAYLWAPKSIVGMSARVGGYVPISDGLIRPQNLTLAP